jgi:hypothetical protein
MTDQQPEPLPEPENLTRPDGTHRIEYEVWAGSLPTSIRIVRYWPETPRGGDHVALSVTGALISGDVRAVLWNDEGVPLVRIS